jgi:hypothetical protein
MRLPRFLIAGVLLFVATILLAGLLAQQPFQHVGMVAAAVFVPLWYMLSAINAVLGVVSAGYPARDEALVFVPVFGIPAVVAGLGWLASESWWNGGPVVHTGRTPVFLAAGIVLWIAVALLAGLLLTSNSLVTAAAVFSPFWLLICVVNLIIGVVAQGYTVLEELPILLLNLAVPVLVAVLAVRVRRSPRMN